jgi:hypothetical protein
MLTADQIELIQREIDGANTPDESVACRALLDAQPEARVLAAELRQLTQLFEGVAEREPPPHLKRAILAGLPRPRILKWRLGTERMGAIMTKKAMLIGSAAVATVVVVASLVTGFPPLTGGAGTIGAGDSIAGVQQAARYRGRSMTQADVKLDSPEVQALLQNDQVLRLVQSDAFRQVMNNEAFRELQSSEMYRELMSSEAYRELQSSESFRELQAKGAFREAQSAEMMRELQSNEAFRQLQSNEAFRKLQSNEAFRALQSNEAFRALQSNEAFRAISRDARMSEAFMTEAMRTQR